MTFFFEKRTELKKCMRGKFKEQLGEEGKEVLHSEQWGLRTQNTAYEED